MSELRSTKEWKQWGKDDPLWSVATWPGKRKGGPSPWTDDQFYALGESDWQDFVHYWRQYGIDTTSCLEIGCGAGRITRQLAQSFDRVYAVDVSAEMIEYAKTFGGCEGVEFAVVDGLQLPQSDSSVKAIFSAHVLQHLDSQDIIFAYFREFFRVLDRGGTIMIHLPLYQLPQCAISGAIQWFYVAFRQIDNIRADIKRRLGIKLMRSTQCPIHTLNLFLRDLGFRNIEFRIFSPRINGDPHPFVFATK